MKCWSLVKCNNCSTIYNRDYNAAQNIFKIASAHVYGQYAFTHRDRRTGMSRDDIFSRPVYLCRAPPVVLAAGVAASSDEDENELLFV